jgi:hypothetical protein
MHKYLDREMYEGEKVMLLHGGLSWVKDQKWFTKDMVLSTMIEKWDFDSFNIKVNKIFWDEDVPWKRNDTVFRDQIAFDMYNFKDLDALVGYLFQASIEGYTIRYVSPDTLTGIYLEKSGNNTTNIDEEVISALIEVVKEANKARKPHDI